MEFDGQVISPCRPVLAYNYLGAGDKWIDDHFQQDRDSGCLLVVGCIFDRLGVYL